MKISVTRSGGFAGVSETLGSIDTSTVKPALAAEAERWVLSTGFFELPAELPSDPGADLFRYEITVERNREHHTVAYFDDHAGHTSALSAFAKWVMHQRA